MTISHALSEITPGCSTSTERKIQYVQGLLNYTHPDSDAALTYTPTLVTSTHHTLPWQHATGRSQSWLSHQHSLHNVSQRYL